MWNVSLSDTQAIITCLRTHFFQSSRAALICSNTFFLNNKKRCTLFMWENGIFRLQWSSIVMAKNLKSQINLIFLDQTDFFIKQTGLVWSYSICGWHMSSYKWVFVPEIKILGLCTTKYALPSANFFSTILKFWQNILLV